MYFNVIYNYLKKNHIFYKGRSSFPVTLGQWLSASQINEKKSLFFIDIF